MLGILREKQTFFQYEMDAETIRKMLNAQKFPKISHKNTKRLETEKKRNTRFSYKKPSKGVRTKTSLNFWVLKGE